MSDVSASVDSAAFENLILNEEGSYDTNLSITVNMEPVTEYIYEQPATYTE